MVTSCVKCPYFEPVTIIGRQNGDFGAKTICVLRIAHLRVARAPVHRGVGPGDRPHVPETTRAVAMATGVAVYSCKRARTHAPPPPDAAADAYALVAIGK